MEASTTSTPSFRGPLTATSCPQASYGVVYGSRLCLYEESPQAPTTTTNAEQQYKSDEAQLLPLLLAEIDLSIYSHAVEGSIQQGLQWEVVLLGHAHAHAYVQHDDGSGSTGHRPHQQQQQLNQQHQVNNGPNKFQSQLAKLRRKSSVTAGNAALGTTSSVPSSSHSVSSQQQSGSPVAATFSSINSTFATTSNSSSPCTSTNISTAASGSASGPPPSSYSSFTSPLSISSSPAASTKGGWLKSKLRSKSISTAAVTQAGHHVVPPPPLPSSSGAPLRSSTSSTNRNDVLVRSPFSPLNSSTTSSSSSGAAGGGDLSRRPSTAADRFASASASDTLSEASHSFDMAHAAALGPPPLVLFTISRDMRAQWINNLQAAITHSQTERGDQLLAQSHHPGRSPSLSISQSSRRRPSLAISPPPPTHLSFSTGILSSDLASYSFPRKPPQSPLRSGAQISKDLPPAPGTVAAAVTPSLQAQPSTPSSSSFVSPTGRSFLELDPTSSRSPSPAASMAFHDQAEDHSLRVEEQPDSAITPRAPVPPTTIQTLDTSRRASASLNPLLPQWISDVRRNSGSSAHDNPAEFAATNHSSVGDGDNACRSPSPRNATQLPRAPRPGFIRQSKSSSFLHLECNGRDIGGLHEDVAPHQKSEEAVHPPYRPIKISIHPDESDEIHHLEATLAASDFHSRASLRNFLPQPEARSCAAWSGSSHGHASGRQTPVSQALLRPSVSMASLSSDAASSLCGGSSSSSSVAQSTDPPTPCPGFVDVLGSPDSADLTPRIAVGPGKGQNKSKLQGYFGVPDNVIMSAPTSPAVQTSSFPEFSAGKLKKEKKTRFGKFDSSSSGAGTKLPLHARLGSVFTGTGSAVQRAWGSSNRVSEDKESIRSAGSASAHSMAPSTCSLGISKGSATSTRSSLTGASSTSRKTSYDDNYVPTPPPMTDVGRHIIDPAELRRLMQERLEGKSRHGEGASRRATVSNGGMKSSRSVTVALDAYTRSSSSQNLAALSASAGTPRSSADSQQFTFGRAHPAQAHLGTATPSPQRELTGYTFTTGSTSAVSSPRIPFAPGTGAGKGLDAQALFAALPPPRRRTATNNLAMSQGSSAEPQLAAVAEHPAGFEVNA